MRKLRVLVLMHEDLVPPQDTSERAGTTIVPWRTEHDVLTALRELGHEVEIIGVHDDLGPLREALERSDPQITFNVLEEFHGVTMYGQAVIAFLELLRRPYTGCNPRGLMLAHDKLLTKKILAYHRIRTPRCATFPVGRAATRPRRLAFPLLVKSIVEDASLGIAQASVVHSDEKLAERVEFMHAQYGTDVLAEEFIEGRELYVGLIGNARVEALPVWEMTFNDWPEGTPRIATERVKWSASYQKRHGIVTAAARDLPPGAEREIVRTCKQVFRALSLSGYARVDLRLDAAGRPQVLELNPLPGLHPTHSDLPILWSALGRPYAELIAAIVDSAAARRRESAAAEPARRRRRAAALSSALS
jgi:D-alanine-D-alanine ligase